IMEEGKSARDTSRHDEVWKTKEGLLTVAGGKLTTYRNMGKRGMSEVGKRLNIIFSETNLTAKVKLPGGDISSDFQAFKQEIKDTLKNTSVELINFEN